jgi:hypothetical protein
VSETWSVPGQQHAPGPTFDITTPHSARVWNYWLGGKDNYPIDRQVGDQICKVFPDIIKIAHSSRAFLSRTVRYLVTEAGIRQFLDIGTGLPTTDNTHEVAQRMAPESRIVYVDNDPLVLVHARALLVGTAEGATDYIDADLRNPNQILSAATRTLDFTKPVGLMLLGAMGNVVDDDEAYAIVDRLVGMLAPGSYLVLNDGTNSQERDEAFRFNAESGGAPYRGRTPKEITRFFDGLELLEPGVVSTPLWRPEPSPDGAPTVLDTYGGVGRKPA